MRLLTVVATTAGLALASTSTAHAATRHVSPAGGTSDCIASPCSLFHAAEISADGDVVVVDAGTYSDSRDIVFHGAVRLLGTPGARPVLEVNSLELLGSGSYAADLTVRGRPDGHKAALIAVGTDASDDFTTIERLEVTNRQEATNDCEFDGDLVSVYDTACYANPGTTTSANAIALNTWSFTDTPDVSGEIDLYNVTAVSSGIAIAAWDGNANVASTIAAGGTPDSTPSDGPADVFAAAGAQISVFSSRYATTAGPGRVHASDGHMLATPRELIFPDLTQGLRPAAGSPTINAGLDDSAPGERDLDGNPRKMGPAPDMGAYEWVTKAPVVTSGGASAVSSGSATVGGSVNAGGDTTRFRVQYGTTAAYGATADGGSIGAGTLPVAVAATITGLAPGTAYHYRVVAKNSLGETPGADRTFTTAAAPAATQAPRATPQPSVKPQVTISLASNKHCRTTRTQSIRVRIASGGRVTSVEVWVNDRRRLRVTKPALLNKTIKVAKLPAGAYTLEVRVKTKDGRTVKSSRKYRTCSAH